MPKRLFLILLTLTVFGAVLTVQADDGIPDNCEYAATTDQRAIIPRYSASTQRLVLVNWNTGEQVRTLSEGVQVVQTLGWSADCRYLAVAEGNSDVMNTVVYDTTTSTRMGSVDDAQRKPHPITWGPDDYLVVETRNGAILWHVPTGQRVTLTTSFNTTTGHNFSRLRWDAATGQLIANLAVGGRVVYDLATGSIVPVAAEQTIAIPPPPNTLQIVIGGRSYPCLGSYSYGYRYWYGSSEAQNVFLRYDIPNQLVDLQLTNYGSGEVIQTLDNRVTASWIVNRGWSPNCHYIAASLGIPGQDASDTVVYDVIAGRRVGVVPDAHQIMHPIQWGADGKTLLVQTRNGAILWDLSTNTQSRITQTAEVPLAGRSDVRNFTVSSWEGDSLLAVPVDAPNTVMVYDPQNGEGHSAATFDQPISALAGEPDGWIAASLEKNTFHGTAHMILFRLDSDQRLDLGSVSQYSSLQFSPDNRYIIVPQRVLDIWDTISGQPNGQSIPQGFYTYQFIDNTTLRDTSGVTFNVATGAYTPAVPVATASTGAPVAGQDGAIATPWWWYGGFYSSRFWNDTATCDATKTTAAYDRAQHALILRHSGDASVLVADLNLAGIEGWSPDCRVIYGRVAIASNANVPYDAAPLDANYLSYNVVFWDATTGAILGTFARPYRFESPARVDWSPGSERAFVRTTLGYFIFDPATSEQIPLHSDSPTDDYHDAINTYYHLYWDFSHGRLFVTTWGGVAVFDLNTGAQITFLSPDGTSSYYSHCVYGGCTFRLSPDGRYLYVLGEGGLGQYDFETLQGVQVDVDNSDSLSRWPEATSPDGRYLIVAGYNVRVWDLANLSPTFTERDPVLIFAGPKSSAQSAQFVDNTTLAITTRAEGVTYWDVETGQQIVNH